MVNGVHSIPSTAIPVSEATHRKLVDAVNNGCTLSVIEGKLHLRRPPKHNYRDYVVTAVEAAATYRVRKLSDTLAVGGIHPTVWAGLMETEKAHLAAAMGTTPADMTAEYERRQADFVVTAAKIHAAKRAAVASLPTSVTRKEFDGYVNNFEASIAKLT